ncbi:hypothetical protein [Methylibium rhizosphaerae]|uniref:hypothetical protein n=1 Tax=Methylibium rhizosphaerae TaxID=2570323 RepID=UPI00112B4807|nr:hypothetical protein [Methylibium rhizosphaerae]
MPPLPSSRIWQEIELHLESRADLITVLVPVDSAEYLPVLRDGAFEVAVPARGVRLKDELAAMRQCGRSIEAALASSLQRANHKDRIPRGEAIRLHGHAVLCVASGHELALCMARAPMNGPAFVPADVHDAAITLDAKLRAWRAAAAASAAVMELANDLLPVSSVDEPAAGLQVSVTKSGVPRLPAEILDGVTRDIANRLPQGLAVRIRTSWAPEVIHKKVEMAIRSGVNPSYPPPRDARYRGWVTQGVNSGERIVLVTWSPYRGLPGYPEVRAASKKCLARAFLQPRQSGLRPDVANSHLVADGEVVVTARPFDPREPSWLKRLEEVRQFDFPKKQQAISRACEAFGQVGLASLGWYQPHHCFAEQAWGIYIHAGRLDAVVSAAAEELRQRGLAADADRQAARLVIGLAYERLLFHARVEAVLTWNELHSGQPRFLRYADTVYKPLRGTGECLEDVLAGYWAWTWFSSELILAALAGAISSEQRSAMGRLVEDWLDGSSIGQARWREGRGREIWRLLATQAIQGRRVPAPTGGALPIESTLRDALPFDFQPTDVPLHIVGQGVVATLVFRSR